jgi:16S rRNA processing protein RimM
MDRAAASRLIRAARVHRPHGVRGEVRAESLGGDASRFPRGTRLTVEPGEAGVAAERPGDGAAPPRVLTVRSARDLGDGDMLLRFDGVESPEAAGVLRGAYLCVEPGEARQLPAGEWFVWQLIGLAAVDPEGAEIGRVSDVESGSAHDVLVVATPSGERRFPMVSAFVAEVSPEAGRLVLTPWEEETGDDGAETR